MKVFLLLAAVIAAASAVSYEDVLVQEFSLFKAQYKKSYENPMENFRRMEIFIQNKYEVAQHNLRYKNGEETYEMEINEYSDWLPEELESMNGFNKELRERLAAGEEVEFPEFDGEIFENPNVTAPDVVNWLEKGAVSPARQQGRCGSCYAFSALASLESLNYIKTNKMVVLSPQQIVDCSGKHGNMGCNGGNAAITFTYIKDNGGVNTESDYPYEGRVGRCRYKPNSVAAKVTGYTRVTASEEALRNAVATVGPVSIAIHALDSFSKYKSGIYSDSRCRSDMRYLNHAVTVVGYDNKQGYWLVKNSWGTSWGDKGYIKMAMNKNNMCGVASYAIYPRL